MGLEANLEMTPPNLISSDKGSIVFVNRPCERKREREDVLHVFVRYDQSCAGFDTEIRLKNVRLCFLPLIDTSTKLFENLLLKMMI